MIVFPDLDPVALAIGPLAVRWYALAYLGGFVLGWRYCLRLVARGGNGMSGRLFDDFLTWAILGTILGGRLGYVLFYNADLYFSEPLEIFKVWHGGMSFHGGMLGVIGAAWIFAQRRNISFWAFTDILACVTPIGLGLGRLANFVNGELYGRVTDMPWGVVFPRGGALPRHPSQLYEALLEGILLFLILFVLSRYRKFTARRGFLSGAFLLGYGMFRFLVELVREPDQQLGFLFGDATMGQLLCLPMMMFGLYLIAWSNRRATPRP